MMGLAPEWAEEIGGDVMMSSSITSGSWIIDKATRLLVLSHLALSKNELVKRAVLLTGPCTFFRVAKAMVGYGFTISLLSPSPDSFSSLNERAAGISWSHQKGDHNSCHLGWATHGTPSVTVFMLSSVPAPISYATGFGTMFKFYLNSAILNWS